MPKLPRIDKQKVRKQLEAQLARQDRGPFAEILADAVQAKPTMKAWRKLAREEPDKYVRSIVSMQQAAGFVNRSEHVQVSLTAEQLATSLLARYGPEKAREMLKLSGLPTTLIPGTSAIDGDAVEIPDTDRPADDV